MSKKILMNINLNLPNHETELKKAENGGQFIELNVVETRF